MFKMILSAVVALGLGSVAFANEGTTTTTPAATGHEAPAADTAATATKDAKKMAKKATKKAGEAMEKKGKEMQGEAPKGDGHTH